MLVKHTGDGNNSGALLLTVFVLTPGAANEWFTKSCGVSTFRDGNGQMNEASPKYPAFNKPDCRRDPVQLAPSWSVVASIGH